MHIYQIFVKTDTQIAFKVRLLIGKNTDSFRIKGDSLFFSQILQLPFFLIEINLTFARHAFGLHIFVEENITKQMVSKKKNNNKKIIQFG